MPQKRQGHILIGWVVRHIIAKHVIKNAEIKLRTRGIVKARRI